MGTTLARTAFLRLGVGAMLASGVAALAWLGVSASSAEESRRVPPPAVDEQTSGSPQEVAALAGGRFWGAQGVFQHVDGVVSAVSGYTGGAAATAHYEMTSEGDTGHAELVRIAFDPGKISYGKLLQIYFSVAHDPTEFNRQGPDEGTKIPPASLSNQRGAGAGGEGLHRPIERRSRVFFAGGDIDRAGQDLLSGGGLSPGFPRPEPNLPLHRVQRPAED